MDLSSASALLPIFDTDSELVRILRQSDVRRLAVNEHAESDDPALVAHATRSLRKLNGLEETNAATFTALSPQSIQQLTALLSKSPYRQEIIFALGFCDISKGGTADDRIKWQQHGTDLSVHNLASADLLPQFTEFATCKINHDVCLALVRFHGIAGQHIRGEVPLSELRRTAIRCVKDPNFSDALLLVNICDTAGVRDGLMTDALLQQFVAIHDGLKDGEIRPVWTTLEGRLARLRKGQIDAGEPVTRVNAATDNVPTAFANAMEFANFWYCESATGKLSAETQLKLIAHAVGLAVRDANVDHRANFHVTFFTLMETLGGSDAQSGYRRRLVEALLHSQSVDDVFKDGASFQGLLAIETDIGDQTAFDLQVVLSSEAQALITLLSIYERKSSAKFHAVLKMLCDLYSLRKDEFDRLSNESEYLKHMNSARSDKSRMLDFAKDGTIVEIGPGGGVVLDLLAEQFEGAHIIGVDVSAEVVEALREKKRRERSRWEVIEADAFELSSRFKDVDTIVLCSLLHEIYSYVEVDGPNGPQKFNDESVRRFIVASLSTLRPGGRLIIRDGVKPANGTRTIKFKDPDGPDFLRLFVEQFEGRAIAVEWVSDTEATLSTPDAMEFLYCYTWGPASFPYEVRELYGVYEYETYIANIIAWGTEANAPCVSVDVSTDLQSYLQPGYTTGLSPKIDLFDESGQPCPLPDSNCIMVFERV